MFLLNKTRCCCQEWQIWKVQVRSKMKIHVFQITFWRTAWRFCSLRQAPMPPLFPPHDIPAHEDHLVQAKLHSSTATSPHHHLHNHLSPHCSLEGKNHLSGYTYSLRSKHTTIWRQVSSQETAKFTREDLESPGCSSCKRLKEEVQSLRARLSVYETQTGKFLI